MENASKAIIIAGAILIAVGLMSLFLVFFQMFKEYNGTAENNRTTQEVNDFNRYFVNSSYDVDKDKAGIQIYGYDVYNIVLKSFELSQRSDLYLVNIKLGNEQVPISTFGTIDAVRDWLGRRELDYNNLLYTLNPDGTQKVTPSTRSGEIIKFKKKYTYDINKYDVEGRVYSIVISECS